MSYKDIRRYWSMAPAEQKRAKASVGLPDAEAAYRQCPNCWQMHMRIGMYTDRCERCGLTVFTDYRTTHKQCI